MKTTYIHTNLHYIFWMCFMFLVFVWGQGENLQDMLGHIIYYPFENSWFAWIVLALLSGLVITGLPKGYWKLSNQRLSLHFLSSQKQSINLADIQKIDGLIEEKLNIYKDDKLIFTLDDSNCHNLPKFVNELHTYQPRLFGNQENPFINCYSLGGDDISLDETFFKLFKVSALLFVSYISLRWLRQDLHVGYYQLVTIMMMVLFGSIAILATWKDGNQEGTLHSKKTKETIKKLKFGVIPLFAVLTAYNGVFLLNEQLANFAKKTTQTLFLGSNDEKNQTWCLQKCTKAIYRNAIYSNNLNNGLSDDKFYQVQAYYGLLGDIVVSVEDLAKAKNEGKSE